MSDVQLNELKLDELKHCRCKMVWVHVLGKHRSRKAATAALENMIATRTAEIRADAKVYLDAARRWRMITLFDGDGRCMEMIASDHYAKLVAEGKSVGGVVAH